jgi:Ca2+:H+ antiporter
MPDLYDDRDFNVVDDHTTIPLETVDAKSETNRFSRQNSTKQKISARAGFMTIVKSSYINILLVFIPLGIASHAVNWSPTTTFILNFLAIVPLAKLLGFATEDIALRTGEVSLEMMSCFFTILKYSPLGDWRFTKCNIWQRSRVDH